jgi:PIN domain nuclease of toxin-antitoxin system
MGAEAIDLEGDARRYAPNRYLLDTSIVIRVIAEPHRLSKAASAIWHGPNRMVAVSVINYWEIALKKEKLGIRDVAWVWEHRVLPYVDMEPIPVSEEHITELLLLPRLHKDPFDRMLIAQARVEDMPLVTPDRQIWKYDVRTVW